MAVSPGSEARGPLVAVIIASSAVVVGEGFHIAHEHLERLLLEIAVHGRHRHAGLFSAAHVAVDKVLEGLYKLLVALGNLNEINVCVHIVWNLDGCLIIDLWFRRHIINIVATTHQKTVLSVIQLFHAPYTPCLVEIREAAYAYPFPFFDCHSFYSHWLEMSELLIFSLL